MTSTTEQGAFDALRFPAFRYAWLAAIVSNTGSFMQNVAIPVVIFEITRRNLWLGIAAFTGSIPGLFGTLLSGPLVDRHDRRKLLVAVNSAMAVLTLLLWVAWVTDNAHLAFLLGVLACSGFLGGLSSTAWQSVQPQLVPPDKLTSAVRLNSTNFAVARAVGPALGTLTLGRYGAGACFMLNALSFLVVIATLVAVEVRPAVPRARTARATTELLEGWRYLRSHPALRLAPQFSSTFAFLGAVWMPLGPALVSQHFDHPSKDSGLLLAAYGVGSVLSGIVLGVRPLKRSRQVYGAALLGAGGLITLAATRSFAVGMVGFAVLGVAHLANAAGLNSAMQVQVDDAYRGRVMSIYLMSIFVAVGTSAVLWAKVSEVIGMRATLLTCAALLAVPMLLRGERRLRALDHETPRQAGHAPRANDAEDASAVGADLLDVTER